MLLANGKKVHECAHVWLQSLDIVGEIRLADNQSLVFVFKELGILVSDIGHNRKILVHFLFLIDNFCILNMLNNMILLLRILL